MATDRLQIFIDDLAALNSRVASLEAHFSEGGRVAKIETGMDAINDKLDTITVFVSGANTVFGLARKHWKRIFVFGAGFVTATGAGNPKVQAIAAYIAQSLGS